MLYKSMTYAKNSDANGDANGDANRIRNLMQNKVRPTGPVRRFSRDDAAAQASSAWQSDEHQPNRIPRA